MISMREAVEDFMKWFEARIDYKAYLESDAWRARADAAKRRAGYRCQLCNRSRTQVILNVHHRTYDNLGDEQPDDLTVLCEDCHKTYEDHRKKNAKRLKQESIDRMLEHARRAKRHGQGSEVFTYYVKDLQRLELPDKQYREVREQIAEILRGERVRA